MDRKIMWRNYWEKVMISSPLPSVKEAKRALKVRTRNGTMTIERLLTFIECIPLAMRVPMSLALTTLFDVAYKGALNGHKYNLDVLRDKDGALRMIINFVDPEKFRTAFNERGEAIAILKRPQ